MLKRFGFEYTPDCPCESHAAEMDARGCKWCRDNIDIIVGWMKEEAENRKVPFIAFVTRRIVLKAIALAERNEPKLTASVQV